MSVTIQSPFSSAVFPSFDYSISPPPAPIAKRARHFFPSNAPTPTPFFFSKGQSILDSTSSIHSADGDKEAFLELERRQVAFLVSRPAPDLKLKPRSALTDATPRTNSSATLHYVDSKEVTKRFELDKMPGLPFTCLPKKAFKPISSPKMPDLPSLSGSDHGVGDNKLSDPTPTAQQAKLPAFQRSGVHRRTVRKRNSLVARSA